MTVLVGIPFGPGCEHFLEEAVDSVLHQSYRDLICLVAGDGAIPPPVTVRDERLRVVSFPTNEGAPMTQQAMLLGSPFGWYAAHGADDWTEPDYLERLLALGSVANASAALWHFDESSEWLVRDRAHVEFGVFDADLLRSVGGYGVQRRCGQDTLLYENILPNVQPIAWSAEPRYHKRIREGSLTHDPATGFGSQYRTETVWFNTDVAQHCAVIGWHDRESIRRFRDAIVPMSLRPILEERVEMVKAVLW